MTLTKNANSAGSLPLQTPDYLTRLNFRPDDALNWNRIREEIEYLSDAGLITSRKLPLGNELVATHAVTSITAKGVDVVEQSGELSFPRTGPVFNAPVGSVQIGDNNSAFVTQYMSADLRSVIEALIALRRSTAHDAAAAKVHSLADEAIAEASKTNAVTDRLKAIILSLGLLFTASEALVQTTGAAIPAYQALYIAAPHIGIHGLPPPPTTP